jgi:hypothetical protein
MGRDLIIKIGFATSNLLGMSFMSRIPTVAGYNMNFNVDVDSGMVGRIDILNKESRIVSYTGFHNFNNDIILNGDFKIESDFNKFTEFVHTVSRIEDETCYLDDRIAMLW